jgi:CRISPR-associated exonuclease Cas4
MYTENELLPLSGLQHLAFCERRWVLIHLEGPWEENVFTAEGALLHEKAHSAAIESRPGVLIRRTLPLHCYRLGLSGQADIVEFLPCDSGQPGIAFPRRKGSWRPFPIEYKRSCDKAGSEAYRIQLCALALCLEEMLAVEVPAGAFFDGKAKRRMEVVFDGELRGQVERLAARM